MYLPGADASKEEDEFSWGSDDDEDETPKDVLRADDEGEEGNSATKSASNQAVETASTDTPQLHPEQPTESGESAGSNHPQNEESAGVRQDSVPKNSPDPSDSFEVVSNKVASTDGERSEDDWDWE